MPLCRHFALLTLQRVHCLQNQEKEAFYRTFFLQLAKKKKAFTGFLQQITIRYNSSIILISIYTVYFNTFSNDQGTCYLHFFCTFLPIPLMKITDPWGRGVDDDTALCTISKANQEENCKYHVTAVVNLVLIVVRKGILMTSTDIFPVT